MSRQYLALVTSWLVLSIAGTLSASTITLDFNAPVPGTLNDANGLGTGFTTRLTGTGSAIPTNDPNMNLTSSPGKLLVTSTNADINQLQLPGPTGVNLPNLEVPGMFVAGVGTNDISITATFDDVYLLNASDQITLYAGADANTIVRAGMHQSNAYVFTQNTGSGDVNTFTGGNAFSTGDNIELTLSRQAGLWSLSWNNLTAATSGALPGFSLPWLDASPNLYVGVLVANAHSTTSFVATIDNFSVTVVPEPASVALFGVGAMVLFFAACREARVKPTTKRPR
jgi:hypothetical protein